MNENKDCLIYKNFAQVLIKRASDLLLFQNRPQRYGICFRQSTIKLYLSQIPLASLFIIFVICNFPTNACNPKTIVGTIKAPSMP